MIAGVSVVLAALGALLLWSTGSGAHGHATTTAGIVMFALGSTGVLASLLSWSAVTARRGRRKGGDSPVVDR